MARVRACGRMIIYGQIVHKTASQNICYSGYRGRAGFYGKVFTAFYPKARAVQIVQIIMAGVRKSLLIQKNAWKKCPYNSAAEYLMKLYYGQIHRFGVKKTHLRCFFSASKAPAVQILQSLMTRTERREYAKYNLFINQRNNKLKVPIRTSHSINKYYYDFKGSINRMNIFY